MEVILINYYSCDMHYSTYQNQVYSQLGFMAEAWNAFEAGLEKRLCVLSDADLTFTHTPTSCRWLVVWGEAQRWTGQRSGLGGAVRSSFIGVSQPCRCTGTSILDDSSKFRIMSDSLHSLPISADASYFSLPLLCFRFLATSPIWHIASLQ